MGQLVFFPVRAQAQIINEIDDLAQVVIALNFYFSLRCNKIPSHDSLLYYLKYFNAKTGLDWQKKSNIAGSII